MRPLRPVAPILLLLAVAALLACGRDGEPPARTLRVLVNPVDGELEQLDAQVASFEEEHGVDVIFLGRQRASSEFYLEVEQYLSQRSAAVDIVEVDVVWTHALADHLIDLSGAIGAERSAFVPQTLAPATVGTRLIGLPIHTDCGLLYYRRDLFEEHGIAAPPATWEELLASTARIVAAEAAQGTPLQAGFLTDLAPQEGLTCATVEWFAAHGGSLFDAHGGAAVDSLPNIEALRFVQRLFPATMPAELRALPQDDVRRLFQQGDIVAIRSWTYAAALLEREDSEVRGKVAVAPLPAGPRGPATTQGGWFLGVSRYSKEQALATELARLLTSERVQAERVRRIGVAPTRVAVYADPALAAEFPHLAIVREALEGAVLRPSDVTRDRYPAASAAVFTAMGRMIAGELSPEAALKQMDRGLRQAVRAPGGS